MIEDSTLGRIPAVTQRQGVITSERKHGLHRGSRTKESNIISEKKTIKGLGRRGRRRGRNTMSGRGSSGTKKSREGIDINRV